MLVFLTGIACLAIGLICLFNKELVWKWQKWQNDTSGVVSQRTKQWEQGVTIAGVIFILTSLFQFFVFSLML